MKVRKLRNCKAVLRNVKAMFFNVMFSMRVVIVMAIHILAYNSQREVLKKWM